MSTPQSNGDDLSFKLLSLLSRERGVYGLRNGEHERYRRHCANKVHRLRQSSGLTNGKGKTFKKAPEITKETIKDVKQLQLLLFSAERALTHSHELKALSTKPNPPVKVRRDQISWLRRALQCSSSLYDISSSLSGTDSRLSTQTLAEITSYHLSVRAELAFERSQWAESLTDLAIRRKLLGIIASAARDDYDQALATEFIDAHDPLIRYAAYKLGRKDSHDIDGVVSDIDQDMQEEALPGLSTLVGKLREETNVAEMEKGRKELEDIHFAGDKVEIRSAELVGQMVKVQEVLRRLKGKEAGGKGKGMRSWDRVLSVLGEAEVVAKRLLDEYEAAGNSSSLQSTRTVQSLSLTHQYIVYLLLSHRIRRDLLLVETLQTSTLSLPQDATKFTISGGRGKVEEAVKTLAAMIKLYDSILQSLSQARSLPIVEEKDGVRTGVEGLEAFFHATRCCQLARLHCIHPTPSFASAVQLLERAGALCRQAEANLVHPPIALEEQIIGLSSGDVPDLGRRIDVMELAAKRALFAERVTKPVFYDTAFNYIEPPMDDLLVLAGKQEKVEKKSEVVAAASAVTGAVVNKAVEQIKEVAAVAAPAQNRTTRETTPAVTDKEEQPKGWLGGWFGRK